ncbi:Chaperone DnaJ-domain superfamily protein, putative isoform 1 [Senna tora]|uniref:Chaperone DnaJ-domain superfamily protein, putative isoform 1 n=1 Tax=Senna tora TaxID=362788 RepID=A0A834T2S4_9FABA|nr:Chaperone DnaJ-domain superfamily protein, putative isoform 1 [Senna tora]
MVYDAVGSSGVSSIDELEEFATGRVKNKASMSSRSSSAPKSRATTLVRAFQLASLNVSVILGTIYVFMEESATKESNHGLRSEDDDITEMENNNIDKSESISSL